MMGGLRKKRVMGVVGASLGRAGGSGSFCLFIWQAGDYCFWQDILGGRYWQGGSYPCPCYCECRGSAQPQFFLHILSPVVPLVIICVSVTTYLTTNSLLQSGADEVGLDGHYGTGAMESREHSMPLTQVHQPCPLSLSMFDQFSMQP